MGGLSSILLNIIQTLASNAIWSGLALPGALFLAKLLKPWWERFIPRLRAWWGRRSDQEKMGVGTVGFVCFCAALSGIYVTTRTPPRPVATSPFAILVADLDGDSEKRQTHHIRKSLETQFGEAIKQGDIEILMRAETLAIPSDGNLKTALEVAALKGRAWLKEQNASVLIWGEVGAGDNLLRLRFLSAKADATKADISNNELPIDLGVTSNIFAPAFAEESVKSYALSKQTLELPNDFGGDLGSLFAAQAANALFLVYTDSAETRANILASFVARLKPLAENPPTSFSDELRAQFWNIYASAEEWLGDERKDKAHIETAVVLDRKILTIWTRDHAPINWAATQTNLGGALLSQGELESGTAKLEEAVAAFREALKEYTRERAPTEWAYTQNNLGIAFKELAERESGTESLKEAVSAYRATLLEWTRDKAPFAWAVTQNNLANALSRLGTRESGTARLEEAVAAYREALKEYTRESAPKEWALTQLNLGLALSSLGQRESGSARLEEAVAAFREAMKEYTRESASKEWALTQNYLGLALLSLGQFKSGFARLEEAVAAFHEALKEYTRESAPKEWAWTQNNLGLALSSLGQRESGSAWLEEAVAAIREALKEYTRESAPKEWAWTQVNLGYALSSLGQRHSGTAQLEESVAAIREALDECMRESATRGWAMSTLGYALSNLGERQSGTERLEEAMSVLQAALQEQTGNKVPLGWAETQNYLGRTMGTLGEREAKMGKARGCTTLQTARDHAAAALEGFRQVGASYDVQEAQRNSTQLDGVIARICG